MKQRKLVIVPKNNHEDYTAWFFDLEDINLANNILQDYYPDGTYEIIETEVDGFESIEEFENWTMENCGYQ